MGCDSILEINLLIIPPSFDTVTVAACNSFTSPSNLQTWTVSGTYNDTLTNSMSCDSILTIHLNILNPSIHTISMNACDSLVSPSGNQTWYQTGTYTDTLINSLGCDSMVTINLTLHPSYYMQQSITSCSSLVSPSGNYTWQNTGIYLDTLTTKMGCDSIIEISLTIPPTTSTTLTESACKKYHSPSGNYVWFTSGTYIDTIPNHQGCDSIITIHLTIDTVNITVLYRNDSLISTANNASFQWLNCNTNTVIPDATDSVLLLLQNGKFSVEINSSGCIDTSNCILVTTVGIEPPRFGTIKISPNPTIGTINIDGIIPTENTVIEIYTILGSLILKTNSQNVDHIDLEIPGLRGTYLMVLYTPRGIQRFTIVKQ